MTKGNNNSEQVGKGKVKGKFVPVP